MGEFKSFLGLVNYYAKFLPNLATVLAPLYQLLRKDVRWQWKSEQEAVFEEVNKLLKSSQLLVYFDSELPLILACDASPYGVGSVLSHQLEDGSEGPIALPPGPWPRQSEAIRNWTKRHLQLLSASNAFTSTSTADHLRFSRITSQYCIY